MIGYWVYHTHQNSIGIGVFTIFTIILSDRTYAEEDIRIQIEPT